MGRRLGSKNRPKDDNGLSGDEPLRNTVDREELRGYITRIEDLNEQQKEVSADRSQVFKELKQAGYDRDTVRALVRRRKMTEEQRDAADALLDQYMSALGDFAGMPLGQAGADRIRDDARAG
jgi:uncharacterized protein (UPF0335 family)